MCFSVLLSVLFSTSRTHHHFWRREQCESENKVYPVRIWTAHAHVHMHTLSKNIVYKSLHEIIQHKDEQIPFRLSLTFLYLHHNSAIYILGTSSLWVAAIVSFFISVSCSPRLPFCPPLFFVNLVRLNTRHTHLCIKL